MPAPSAFLAASLNSSSSRGRATGSRRVSAHPTTSRPMFCISKIQSIIPLPMVVVKVARDGILCSFQVRGPVHRPAAPDARKAPASPAGLPGRPRPLRADQGPGPGCRGTATGPGAPGTHHRWRGHRGDTGCHLPGFLRGQMRGPLELSARPGRCPEALRPVGVA